jgi:hypothetical protein
MAEQMIPTGAATTHFAPSFAELQTVVEAIDRAIRDEKALPSDYAVDEPRMPVNSEGFPMSAFAASAEAAIT